MRIGSEVERSLAIELQRHVPVFRVDALKILQREGNPPVIGVKSSVDRPCGVRHQNQAFVLEEQNVWLRPLRRVHQSFDAGIEIRRRSSRDRRGRSP